MVWNTNDWDTREEDKHWEMTEEDTDDEFDDLQLARMGVDLPEFAKETPFIQPVSPPRVIDVDRLMRQWQDAVNANAEVSPEVMEAFASMIDASGTIHFGDEPPESQGIDPVLAGFEGAEEWLAEAVEMYAEREEGPEWDTSGTDESLDDYDPDDYCPECGIHLEELCDCGSVFR